MLQPAGFAGQAGLFWRSPVTLVRVAKAGTGTCRGSGGTERGHPATEANFRLEYTLSTIHLRIQHQLTKSYHCCWLLFHLPFSNNR